MSWSFLYFLPTFWYLDRNRFHLPHATVRRDRMKRISILLLCLFLFADFGLAQVTTSGLTKAENLDKTVYGLGFSASAASGLGVSFRAHLPSKSSFQGVFGIIKTSNKLYLSIGGEFQYDLV